MFHSLYGPWITSFLDTSVLAEQAAPCANCVMLRDHDAADDRRFFNPATKCCTYFPSLPSFSVGHILADDSSSAEDARSILSDRIRAGADVTPLGLMRPRSYSLLYRHSPTAFGEARKLRCPYYDATEGRCLVWPYRMSTCATWHCKHDRGARGARFWETLRRVLANIERSLTLHCALQLDLPRTALEIVLRPSSPHAHELQSADIDQIHDGARHDEVWGSWAGRETEYFERCGRLVSELRWDDVLRLGGQELEALAQLARDLFHELSRDSMPESLQVSRFEISRMEEGTVWITTYSQHDPIGIPHSVLEVLSFFDGRPTRDALCAIENERGAKLDLNLLQNLFDYDILSES